MRRCWLLFVGVLLAMVLPGEAGARDKDGAFVMGLIKRDSMDGQRYGQIVGILEQVMRVYAEQSGTAIVVRALRGNAGAEDLVKSHTVDLLLNDMPQAMEQGYAPFLYYGVFGEPEPGDCLIARKDLPGRDATAFRGNKVVVRQTVTAFLHLWDLVDENPMTFFSKVASAADEQSAVFAVSLGEADVGVVDLWSFKFLEMSNPGVTGKVRLVACVPGCKKHFLISPDVPAKERAALRKFFLEAPKNPGLKPYRATVKQFGLILGDMSGEDLARCEAVNLQDLTPEQDPRVVEFRYWQRYQKRK